MNQLFKKSLFLAAVAVCFSSAANADDLFDDSFFADPAPVNAVKTETPAPAEVPPAAAEVTGTIENNVAEPAAPVAAPVPEASPAVAMTDGLNSAVSDAGAPSFDKMPEPSAAPAPLSDFDSSASFQTQPKNDQLNMDFSMPSADLNAVPPPPSGNPSASSAFGLDFGADNKQMNLSQPQSEQVLGKIPSDVFREMAEIERENNALMLQLKREHLRSEIDALKTSNRQMLFDEIERREKMTQARLEWELAQDLKRQEALERKQKAEIRQKQIEAALKREEDRRIQKMKDEKAAQEQKQKDEAEAAKKKQEELKKRYDAAAMIQVKELMPALIAATRPAKIKRYASSRVATTLTTVGEEMLSKKKAGEALIMEIPVEQDKENSTEKEVVVKKPASSIYAVTEIRGTAGVLIAKLVNKEEHNTFFVKKSTILPSGHTVASIDKDFVILQMGKDKEMIGFPSAGLMADTPKEEASPRQAPKKREKSMPVAKPTLTPKRKVAPSLSAVSLAK